MFSSVGTELIRGRRLPSYPLLLLSLVSFGSPSRVLHFIFSYIFISRTNGQKKIKKKGKMTAKGTTEDLGKLRSGTQSDGKKSRTERVNVLKYPTNSIQVDGQKILWNLRSFVTIVISTTSRTTQLVRERIPIHEYRFLFTRQTLSRVRTPNWFVEEESRIWVKEGSTVGTRGFLPRLNWPSRFSKTLLDDSWNTIRLFMKHLILFKLIFGHEER